MNSYEEAKIRERVNTAVTHGEPYELDLSGLSLTIDNLKELVVVIKKRLPGLKVLNLSKNRLTELPDALFELTSLKSLHLEHNSFTDFPENIKQQLPSLRKVNLKHNPLTQKTKRQLLFANDVDYDFIVNPYELGLYFLYKEDRNTGLQILSLIEKEPEAQSKFRLPFGKKSTVKKPTVQDILKLFFINVKPFLNNKSYHETFRYLLDEIKDSIASEGENPKTLLERMYAMYNSGKGYPKDFIETLVKLHNYLKTLYDPVNDKEKIDRILQTMVSGEEYTLGNGLKVSTIQFWKNWLEKTPEMGSFKKTITYLFDEVANGNTDTLHLMATALGNCATPVKSFLLQTAIGLARDEKIDVDPKILDQLIAREALKERTLWALKEAKVWDNNYSEAIEGVEGLLNAVFLEGAERNVDNKIKIKGDRVRMSSTSAYIVFSFIKSEWIVPFAQLCCKTDANGIPEQDAEGCYSFAPEKLLALKEAYYTKLGIRSPIEIHIDSFEAEFIEFMQKDNVSHLALHCDKDDVGAAIDSAKQAEKLREVLHARNTTDPQVLEQVTTTFFNTVQQEIEGLAKKYPDPDKENDVDVAQLAESPKKLTGSHTVERRRTFTCRQKKNSLPPKPVAALH